MLPTDTIPGECAATGDAIIGRFRSIPSVSIIGGALRSKIVGPPMGPPQLLLSSEFAAQFAAGDPGASACWTITVGLHTISVGVISTTSCSGTCTGPRAPAGEPTIGVLSPDGGEAEEREDPDEPHNSIA